MNLTNYDFKPTIIGSMPHTDPGKACRLITSYLDTIPAWPQLPKRSPLEGMSLQFSRGFPGLENIEGKLKFKHSDSFEKALEGLYDNYLRGDYAEYEVTAEYAAGLHHFLGMGGVNPLMVKGQVTGPVSWCLTIADETGKPILYDEILADAADIITIKRGIGRDLNGNTDGCL